MKLLGSLLFASAVKAEGDMGGMMPMGDHGSMDMGDHGSMDMGGDMEDLEDLVVETTAAPTSMPMESTTGHHMHMMTHAEMEDHHEVYHEEEYHEEEHHEEHKEEHYEEPHYEKPCNSCGCNAEEMAQWKASMMVWKADHQGKSDFPVLLVENTLTIEMTVFPTIVVFPYFNEVKGLNESYMTANQFYYTNVKA